MFFIHDTSLMNTKGENITITLYFDGFLQLLFLWKRNSTYPLIFGSKDITVKNTKVFILSWKHKGGFRSEIYRFTKYILLLLSVASNLLNIITAFLYFCVSYSTCQLHFSMKYDTVICDLSDCNFFSTLTYKKAQLSSKFTEHTFVFIYFVNFI
jgi:hypothetical protein